MMIGALSHHAGPRPSLPRTYGRTPAASDVEQITAWGEAKETNQQSAYRKLSAVFISESNSDMLKGAR
jgi:hypothetical protein